MCILFGFLVVSKEKSEYSKVGIFVFRYEYNKRVPSYTADY